MKPLKVFISYSHTDEELCKKLLNHLASLKRRGIIKEWFDRKLIAGQDWDKNIKQELIDSDIIILLISSDFIASDYCYDVEIKKALEQHEKGYSVVIPIILRPCDWQSLPFSKIQGLPKDARPITKWENTDEALLNVVEGIKKLASSLTNKGSETFKNNNEVDNSEFLTFDRDVVLCLLPRGYIIIEDIEFMNFSSWSVVAGYYNYKGEWTHGTHYHESYRNEWETLEGRHNQCRKLFIPKADAIYTDTAIEIMMALRERDKDQSIEEIVNLYSSDDGLNKYYPKNSKISKPVVPKLYCTLNKTGELRDIMDELNISPWKNYELQTLHLNMESLQRKSQLVTFDLLPENHPAYLFVKQVAERYDCNFNLEQLTNWADQLNDSLMDATSYIKE